MSKEEKQTSNNKSSKQPRNTPNAIEQLPIEIWMSILEFEPNLSMWGALRCIRLTKEFMEDSVLIQNIHWRWCRNVGKLIPIEKANLRGISFPMVLRKNIRKITNVAKIDDETIWLHTDDMIYESGICLAGCDLDFLTIEVDSSEKHRKPIATGFNGKSLFGSAKNCHYIDIKNSIAICGNWEIPGILRFSVLSQSKGLGGAKINCDTLIFDINHEIYAPVHWGFIIQCRSFVISNPGIVESCECMPIFGYDEKSSYVDLEKLKEFVVVGGKEKLLRKRNIGFFHQFFPYYSGHLVELFEKHKIPIVELTQEHKNKYLI